MKAVVIRSYGGPEVLELLDMDPPEPKDDEVLVKVHAASINPIDWQIREGLVKMFIRPKFPAILGCDFAGEIAATGRNAKRFQVGDPVFAMMPHDYGAQAELIALPEELVARKPEKMTMVEAGSVGATAITAVHALRDIANVGPETKLLVNGASGGVGIFAVQVAKDLGAHVTAVAGGASKALVESLGADAFIDYKTTDFTGGDEKFDVVFDCIGNAPHDACKRVMVNHFIHITTMAKGKTFVRSFMNPLLSGRVVPMIAKSTPDRIEHIRARLESGKLRTVIDKVLPAKAVAEAHEYSKSGRAKGKIVLTFQD